MAALRPLMAMTLPPGWVQAPHRGGAGVGAGWRWCLSRPGPKGPFAGARPADSARRTRPWTSRRAARAPRCRPADALRSGRGWGPGLSTYRPRPGAAAPRADGAWYGTWPASPPDRRGRSGGSRPGNGPRPPTVAGWYHRQRARTGPPRPASMKSRTGPDRRRRSARCARPPPRLHPSCGRPGL